MAFRQDFAACRPASRQAREIGRALPAVCPLAGNGALPALFPLVGNLELPAACLPVGDRGQPVVEALLRAGGAAPRDAQMPTWAITQNPLIYRNLLIVAAQTSQAGVVAFDKLTGELKWKSDPLSGGVGYVSPCIVKIGGEDHLVMSMASAGMGRSAGGGSVNGIDPLSGKTLWTYSNWQCRIPVPHAVDAGEGRVLITGGYSAGTAMIRVQKKDDGSYGVTELFKNMDFWLPYTAAASF